jgi:hypothetical protein
MANSNLRLEIAATLAFPSNYPFPYFKRDRTLNSNHLLALPHDKFKYSIPTQDSIAIFRMCVLPVPGGEYNTLPIVNRWLFSPGSNAEVCTRVLAAAAAARFFLPQIRRIR